MFLFAFCIRFFYSGFFFVHQRRVTFLPFSLAFVWRFFSFADSFGFFYLVASKGNEFNTICVTSSFTVRSLKYYVNKSTRLNVNVSTR